jgi:hypothetical protein
VLSRVSGQQSRGILSTPLPKQPGRPSRQFVMLYEVGPTTADFDNACSPDSNRPLPTFEPVSVSRGEIPPGKSLRRLNRRALQMRPGPADEAGCAQDSASGWRQRRVRPEISAVERAGLAGLNEGETFFQPSAPVLLADCFEFGGLDIAAALLYGRSLLTAETGGRPRPRPAGCDVAR